MAEATGNHFEPRGCFTSNDPALGRLFEIVRRTADLNVVDRTMDNPSRERRQYLGDCSSIILAVTACFGDSALLRRYFLNAAEGQHGTGLYRYSYPGHDDDGASLFDHALSVPIRLWEHYQRFADAELVAALWPGIERFMHLLISCLDERDRMPLPPYNVYFDWGHMDRRGFFLPLHAMSVEALRSAASLADAIGAPAGEWGRIAARMAARVSDWFDPERGVFVDAIIADQRQAHYSEHANSLVAHWKLAPDEMIQSALDRWAEAPEAFGQTSPAWQYLPSAFIRAGRPELALHWMHRRLGQLSKQELTTWPETWCLHGERTTGTWRCRDSRAVAQGAGLGIPTALLEDLCGIRPGAPGFATVHLTPQPGPLTSLTGTLPGPDGDYTLALEKTVGGWILRLELPSPRQVVLDTAFAPGAREAQTATGALYAVDTLRLPGGREVGRFVWDADVLSELHFADPGPSGAG